MAIHVGWNFARKPLEERKKKGLKYCQKYEFAGKVPLIIGKDARSEDLLELPDEEFIVSSNMKVSQLRSQINRQMQRDPSAPLYLYVNVDTILHTDMTLGDAYQEHRGNDYFLYLAYSENNVHSRLAS